MKGCGAGAKALFVRSEPGAGARNTATAPAPTLNKKPFFLNFAHR